MDYGTSFLAIGGLLLASLAIDYVGKRIGVPRVSLLVAFGIIVGPAVLDLIPVTLRDTTDLVASVALLMVAFMLGSDLEIAKLRRHGRQILIVSTFVVLITTLIVAGGLIIAGVALIPTLLLAAISTATAPTATRAVVMDEDAKGAFAETLLGIVAVDDAWGLIIFAIATGVAAALTAGAADGAVLGAVWDLLGAIALGAVIGFPAAYLTGRIRPGSPSLLEGLGVVLSAGGAALLLNVSFILTAIVTGAIIANFARHHERSFREIEHVEGPILVVFFVLAGASMDLDAVLGAGLAGAAYVTFRVVGRVAGGWIGGSFADLRQAEKRWIGAALLPQAGIALGMALIAAREFPEYGDTILAVAIGSTVVFELFGPIATRMALSRVRPRVM